MKMDVNIIYNENCLTGLQKLPDNCIDCCVTSPPYFGLRNYGHDDQLGLESTPEEYVANMVKVFSEVKRVLKNEGTLWLNIGDSYAGSGGAHKEHHNNPGISNSFKRKGVPHWGDLGQPENYVAPQGMKPKDLMGIPWMVAFALRADGWYLRQDIIWHKPNPMPESVTDRCTKSHEYIFLLSKSERYYYDADAIKTDLKEVSIARLDRGVSDSHKNINGAPGQPPHTMSQPRKNKAVRFGGNKGDGNSRSGIYSGKEWKPKGYEHRGEGDKKLTGHSGNFDAEGGLIGGGMANKKSVWTVTTKPFSESHFATFPEDLIVDMIKAGCPQYVCNECGTSMYVQHDIGSVEINKGPVFINSCDCKEPTFSPGIVLDNFMGAGTTALVAKKLNRSYIGFELNSEYVKMSQKRLRDKLGLFI